MKPEQLFPVVCSVKSYGYHGDLVKSLKRIAYIHKTYECGRSEAETRRQMDELCIGEARTALSLHGIEWNKNKKPIDRL